MAELEVHTEGGEHHDPTGRKVGVLAAVLAVLLAVVTIASHRTHTAAIIHKTTANDDWAYFQANSIKSQIEALGLSIPNLPDSTRAQLADQQKKYDALKEQQQEKATQSDEAAEADERRALRYDLGEGLLEIALVLTSLYFVSRKVMFPVMGIVAGIGGVVIAITGLSGM